MIVFRMALLFLVFHALMYQGWADTLSGARFIVDFHPDDRETATETLAWLEEARAAFEQRLPFGEEPVHVRIAGNMNEFLGLSGTYAHVGVSGVTRADRSLIALKSPRLRSLGDDYRGTVRHELIHILLHRNTDTSVLPRWLNEGICMMLANELRWGSTLQVARMHLSGQLLDLDALDRVFTYPGSDYQFGNAYAQALSLTRHLYDELGEEKFWAVVGALHDETFSQALVRHGGISVDAFWQDYRSGMWGHTLIAIARTGSFWGGISFLCILAFLVRHWRNRAILQRWASREDADDEEEPFDWDSVLPDGDDWKQ